MKIGVPKEIKTNENRVAVVPAGAESLVAAGHEVFIEHSAGEGSGFDDAAYAAVGAKILPTAKDVWGSADLVVKVKEPIAPEWPLLRKDLAVFTYFHFAADEKLTRAHLDSGATCIAYETVELPTRELPLLTPMSEVAGRMAVQEGAKYLEKELFEMKPLEPFSTTVALGILFCSAVIAVGIPAARASALQPSETLRQE